MTKSKSAKPAQKKSRQPDVTRRNILDAALVEFDTKGLAGARIDEIAARSGSNKRMIYYHVGNKEQLYLEVLEGAYAHIRIAERQLNLEAQAPAEAIAGLIRFTWQYFIDHPEFLALLNTENLHAARYLKHSTRVKEMHSPFVALIDAVLRRGEKTGEFRPGIDAVQLYISIAGLAYFYLSNQATLSVIFGRNLLAEKAKAERLAHMTELVLKSLQNSR
jgi:AcrR family transcriptional regulator